MVLHEALNYHNCIFNVAESGFEKGAASRKSVLAIQGKFKKIKIMRVTLFSAEQSATEMKVGEK